MPIEGTVRPAGGLYSVIDVMIFRDAARTLYAALSGVASWEHVRHGLSKLPMARHASCAGSDIFPAGKMSNPALSKGAAPRCIPAADEL